MAELAAKWLELPRELVPLIVRVGVLVNPANALTTRSKLRDVEPAARAIGLQTQVLHASTNAEIDAAFAWFARERTYTGRILKGAKPGDLCQSCSRALVINLRTAKARWT